MTPNKVMIIGSGPIVIGQAAEFDYAGTQACEALQEEGVEVILLNSNPATIMTDYTFASKVYMEPLTPDFVEQIIRQERPDGLLATLGGQTGLNLALALDQRGVLEREQVEILGTKLDAIRMAEDRDLFRDLMQRIGQPIPDSTIAENVQEAAAFAQQIGYPVIVRPAFTLGGTGGGIARDERQLVELVASGLRYSPISQCLVEKSIAGMKEIEYEVMRDQDDNCIVVCNMENLDPVGVHTGDSIVVAPSQTLADREYQMLRSASIDIVRALGIEGACNVQLALDPDSFQYYVIEVNPRVSRSSALASKATGYPIAKIAAKIALGQTLDKIVNPVTGRTFALFEPALDYVVTKLPRFPFDKFPEADRRLGTQMKATGEVMAIGRTFEASLQKAIRSLELGVSRLTSYSFAPDIELESKLTAADDERLFALAAAFQQGYSIERLHELTGIDEWFLMKLRKLVDFEQQLRHSPLTPELLLTAKKLGFTDADIADIVNGSGILPGDGNSVVSINGSGKLAGNSCARTTADEITELRKRHGIVPVYKTVDTCAGEFEALTPYYYSAYESENEAPVSAKPKVVVLGSGPIRIGQGIEFDYSTVHAVQAIRELGYEAVVINNNPETVSTDFNISDRLYFEPLYMEDILHIIEHEEPVGVIVQFGGQTAVHLAKQLSHAGIPILGTPMASIDTAEDRKQFEALLRRLAIRQPKGGTASSFEEALSLAEQIGFPVLVRPSYVIGGRAMVVAHTPQQLQVYMERAIRVNPDYPVLIDRYMHGVEMEVDAISDGTDVLIPGIMEQIEKTGVHSGDSIAVYPPQTLSSSVKEQIIAITEQIARSLKVIGLINIQFLLDGDQVYVIEVNPRASRTVPFMSKITGIPIAKLAAKLMMGRSLQDLGYAGGLMSEPLEISVKVPVFSFAKLPLTEAATAPEMKSTGEVIGRDVTYSRALYKGLLAAGLKLPDQGKAVVSLADPHKEQAVEAVKVLAKLGYAIYATPGTARALQAHNIPVHSGTTDEWVERMHAGEIDMLWTTCTQGGNPARPGFKLRRAAVESGVSVLTSIDTISAVAQVMRSVHFQAVVL